MKLGLTLAAILASALVAPTTAYAQAPGECSGGFCGTPNQEGGGGCGCGGGSILVNNTDLGETYSTSDDFDGDGYEDDFDNCPFITNRDQVDGDGDQIGDGCDNAPARPNLDQLDIDGDGIGDVADEDIDNDGHLNGVDNCARVFNPTQRMTLAGSLSGDACNDDDDADGIRDSEDACPKISGTAQVGACDDDEDLDSVLDAVDNCPGTSNQAQGDLDHDGIGDGCDVDMDGDMVPNNLDNAKEIPNPDQGDDDRDGIGNVADNQFCYVFDRTAMASCLSPDDTFKVGALAVNAKEMHSLPTTGLEMKLELFANRANTPIEYTWNVSKAPKGSTATVQGAVGQVTTTLPGTFQYAQAKTGNNVAPKFVADEPGEYELKLVARLVFADEVIIDGPQVATYSVKLTATGDAQAGSGGCQTVNGGSAGLSSLFLVALGFLALRRKAA